MQVQHCNIAEFQWGAELVQHYLQRLYDLLCVLVMGLTSIYQHNSIGPQCKQFTVCLNIDAFY